MHTLDIEDSKSNSGGGGGGALKWVLIGLGVFILIAAIVAIAVILTLPQTFTCVTVSLFFKKPPLFPCCRVPTSPQHSCFPHDSRYFVKLVPNGMQISPLVPVAWFRSPRSLQRN
jgi:hypothetical protein